MASTWTGDQTGRQSVDSVISILRSLELASKSNQLLPGEVEPINPHPCPRPTPVHVLSELSLPSPFAANPAYRAYSLYSTDSDSTITGTKKAMDKVSKLISLLMGEEIVLTDDFDETFLANQVLDNLKRKAMSVGNKENLAPGPKTRNQTNAPSPKTPHGNGSKSFPKAIRRKTISVKNVKAKPVVASTMKQQNAKTNKTQPGESQPTPAKFTRQCCQQRDDLCAHAASAKKMIDAPKISLASWETPPTTIAVPHASAFTTSVPVSARTAFNPSTPVAPPPPPPPPPPPLVIPSANPSSHCDRSEVPVRDSDPDPLPPHPPPHLQPSQPLPVSQSTSPSPPLTSPLEGLTSPSHQAVVREIEIAAASEEASGRNDDDLVKTFHSQRRALRFLVNELRESLTSNYGKLDAHCARTLEAIDKIVSLMQKSKYVPPSAKKKKSVEVKATDDDDDGLSTASFASIDIDLALQPLRDENVQLRAKLREATREARDIQMESQVWTKIFEEVGCVAAGSSMQAKAMVVKEKLTQHENEVGSAFLLRGSPGIIVFICN